MRLRPVYEVLRRIALKERHVLRVGKVQIIHSVIIEDVGIGPVYHGVAVIRFRAGFIVTSVTEFVATSLTNLIIAYCAVAGFVGISVDGIIVTSFAESIVASLADPELRKRHISKLRRAFPELQSDGAPREMSKRQVILRERLRLLREIIEPNLRGVPSHFHADLIPNAFLKRITHGADDELAVVAAVHVAKSDAPVRRVHGEIISRDPVLPVLSLRPEIDARLAVPHETYLALKREIPRSLIFGEKYGPVRRVGIISARP